MKGNRSSRSPARRSQADRSAATRAALVKAARPLFAKHGFSAVGTEAIVQAAGVTRGAMYHQFADKRELFAAVFEAVEADVNAKIEAAGAGVIDEDPIRAMELGANAWLEAAADTKVQRILVLDAPAVLGWDRWREIGLRYGLGLVEALLTYAMEAGKVRRQPVRPLAHVLIGALDEAASYVARSDDPGAARSEMRDVIAQLVAALSAPKSRRRTSSPNRS